jgi:urease gamma subunit
MQSEGMHGRYTDMSTCREGTRTCRSTINLVSVKRDAVLKKRDVSENISEMMHIIHVAYT